MDGEFDINTAVSTPTRLERIDILLLKISCETELKTNILPVIFLSSDCGAGVWFINSHSEAENAAEL